MQGAPQAFGFGLTGTQEPLCGKLRGVFFRLFPSQQPHCCGPPEAGRGTGSFCARSGNTQRSTLTAATSQTDI